VLVVVVVVGLLVVEIYIANAATELVSIAVVPCRVYKDISGCDRQ